MQNLGQILFVMWRETVEAMLVIGILHAWISHNASVRRGLIFLWAGVAAGLGGALLLGLGIEAMNTVLSDEGQEYFQAGMLLVAAALIVQMVFWMRHHGRTLKKNIEASLSEKAEQGHWWGVFGLAAIAVAREGSEAVIFLSSLAMGGSGFASPEFWLALVLGFLLAAATFWLLQLGSKRISWRAFFRVTEAMLLLLGCSLLVAGVDRLIGVQALPALMNQVWNSSALLDDGSFGGALVSAFTGYRARPTLMTLLVFLGYWGSVAWAMRGRTPVAQP